MTTHRRASLFASALLLLALPSLASLPRYEPRPGRARPVIAVIGYNPATEVTDYVVPFGILADADVADVIALSTESGPIEMRPALRFEVHATIAEFDRRYAAGADYVIVPNIYEGADNDALLRWLREQSRRGATIVGICDGVPVLANAGLLDGRKATAHWRTIDRLERAHRGTQWVRNRRYVADGKVITTSGVSASIPISIALVEAIAGRGRAQLVARRLGVEQWSAEHDSEQFRLGLKLLTGLRNKMMVWAHEDLGVRVTPGVDEIALALTADIYSRTRRSWVFSIAGSPAPILTRRGLKLIPDRTAGEGEAPAAMLALRGSEPATALERALAGVRSRYGDATAAFVAVQIEYADVANLSAP